jgi:hypothetical protein
MHMHGEGTGVPNGACVGGELGRRQRDRGVLGPRTPPVQASLDRHAWPMLAGRRLLICRVRDILSAADVV